jgi:hypothetical protein
MEKKVFTAPAVAGILNGMVESRVHNDKENQDEVRDWQVKLVNSFATPTYILIDPQTDKIIDVHAGPEMDPELFSAWLRGALAKAK